MSEYMLTSVVAELWQSLLQVVVLLSELAAQLVQRLVEYPVWLVCIQVLLWPVLLLEVEML